MRYSQKMEVASGAGRVVGVLLTIISMLALLLAPFAYFEVGVTGLLAGCAIAVFSHEQLKAQRKNKELDRLQEKMHSAIARFLGIPA